MRETACAAPVVVIVRMVAWTRFPATTDADPGTTANEKSSPALGRDTVALASDRTGSAGRVGPAAN
ncbi:hypothetical protein [Micromonospora carbonacea]|uniref:hypothetical protein n=1 Tax=Micromonospora carbonacea TaxID=47853 RepID=UPI00159F1E16|nr:hypothetical protein [Micromonospora carbonacea]